jgi:hypothetical protein
MERKEYKLMTTVLKDKYFVVTSYREATTLESIWYFETIAFNFNINTKTIGGVIEMDDSGVDEASAIENHFLIVQKLNQLP